MATLVASQQTATGANPPPHMMTDQAQAHVVDTATVIPCQYSEDHLTPSCPLCHSTFSYMVAREYCRACGRSVCQKCLETQNCWWRFETRPTADRAQPVEQTCFDQLRKAFPNVVPPTSRYVVKVAAASPPSSLSSAAASSSILAGAASPAPASIASPSPVDPSQPPRFYCSAITNPNGPFSQEYFNCSSCDPNRESPLCGRCIKNCHGTHEVERISPTPRAVVQCHCQSLCEKKYAEKQKEEADKKNADPAAPAPPPGPVEKPCLVVFEKDCKMRSGVLESDWDGLLRTRTKQREDRQTAEREAYIAACHADAARQVAEAMARAKAMQEEAQRKAAEYMEEHRKNMEKAMEAAAKAALQARAQQMAAAGGTADANAPAPPPQ